MIIVDSCGCLEWFTDGKLADVYNSKIISSDADLKSQSCVDFIPKN